jgi:hypothetical protein
VVVAGGASGVVAAGGGAAVVAGGGAGAVGGGAGAWAWAVAVRPTARIRPMDMLRMDVSDPWLLARTKLKHRVARKPRTRREDDKNYIPLFSGPDYARPA